MRKLIISNQSPHNNYITDGDRNFDAGLSHVSPVSSKRDYIAFRPPFLVKHEKNFSGPNPFYSAIFYSGGDVSFPIPPFALPRRRIGKGSQILVLVVGSNIYDSGSRGRTHSTPADRNKI